MSGYRKLIQGTCGWSDQSLVSCNRFYPKKSLSAAEKLSFYSREGGFGCVEVDSSTYAIPSVINVQSWIDSTPKEFIFHFKAFGLLVSKSIQYNHLPRSIKDQLNVNTSYPSGNKYITLDVLGHDLTEQLWALFNNSVLPAYNANKLGIIVFQFQLNVTPNDAAREHITYCAEMLDQRYKMAVEFRNRSWISEEQLPVTIAFLRALRIKSGGVALICCDDLEHEVYMKEEDVMLLLESNANNHKKLTSASVTATTTTSAISTSTTNTTASTTPLDIDTSKDVNRTNVTSSSGAEDSSSSSTTVNNTTSIIDKSTSAAAATCSFNKPIPIILDLEACPLYVYIRVHRRYGSHRVLAQWEIGNWVQRLNQAVSRRQQVVNHNSNRGNACTKHVASESSTADSQSPKHSGNIDDICSSVDNNLQGPIYFLWGTDHEDQPILNAYNLQKALLESESKLVDVNDRKIFSYKNKIEGSGSIKSMFAKMANNTSSTSITSDNNLSTIVNNTMVTDQSSISTPMSPTTSGEASTKKRKITLSSPVGNSKSSIENYFKKK